MPYYQHSNYFTLSTPARLCYFKWGWQELLLPPGIDPITWLTNRNSNLNATENVITKKSPWIIVVIAGLRLKGICSDELMEICLPIKFTLSIKIKNSKFCFKYHAFLVLGFIWSGHGVPLVDSSCKISGCVAKWSGLLWFHIWFLAVLQ